MSVCRDRKGAKKGSQSNMHLELYISCMHMVHAWLSACKTPRKLSHTLITKHCTLKSYTWSSTMHEKISILCNYKKKERKKKYWGIAGRKTREHLLCLSLCYPAVTMTIHAADGLVQNQAFSKANKLFSFLYISMTHVQAEWFGCVWYYFDRARKCKTEVAMETDGVQWESRTWVWPADWQGLVSRTVPSALVN